MHLVLVQENYVTREWTRVEKVGKVDFQSSKNSKSGSAEQEK
jgi:hypothetical protein